MFILSVNQAGESEAERINICKSGSEELQKQQDDQERKKGLKNPSLFHILPTS